MKKVLVIGANGFTGRQILKDLSAQKEYKVTACSLREDLYPGIGIYHYARLNICNAAAVETLFKEVSPEIVINTSALSVPDYCESHREEAYTTNASAVGEMARCCQRYGSRFIHLSTDFVFDGKSERLYTEKDRPNPVNYYGFTKWEGEKRIAAQCDNYAIARVAIVYGNALPGQHGNIFQLVANRLRTGQAIRVVSDQWRTPTFVEDVSQGIKRLVDTTANGIFHICGNECLTIAGIAYRVAEHLHLDRSLIHPVTTEKMGEATPRPLFSGMSMKKAQEELGYYPRSIEQGIKESLL